MSKQNTMAGALTYKEVSYASYNIANEHVLKMPIMTFMLRHSKKSWRWHVTCGGCEGASGTAGETEEIEGTVEGAGEVFAGPLRLSSRTLLRSKSCSSPVAALTTTFSRLEEPASAHKH